MKSLSFAPVVRFAFIAGLMLCVASAGFAADTESSGKVSEQLAHALFCDTAGMLEGDIGLILGLVLVFSGLWSLIQGAKIAAAVPVIIIGSLITAIPSLIISTAAGFGDLLTETGISGSDASTFITSSMKSCPDSKNIINDTHDETESGETFGSFERAKANAEAGNCTGGYMDCQ